MIYVWEVGSVGGEVCVCVRDELYPDVCIGFVLWKCEECMKYEEREEGRKLQGRRKVIMLLILLVLVKVCVPKTNT